MSASIHSKTPEERKPGLSSDMFETAPGSEILETFLGAAIGIDLPEVNGIGVHEAVDAVDEFQQDRASSNPAGNSMVLGQKNVISKDFNFGGQHYTRQSTEMHEQTENIPADQPGFKAKGKSAEIDDQMNIKPAMDLPPASRGAPCFIPAL